MDYNKAEEVIEIKDAKILTLLQNYLNLIRITLYQQRKLSKFDFKTKKKFICIAF